MAAVASQVFGAVVNAVAFSGGSMLFGLINKGGYTKEMHRHNLAMEELAKAKEKFYEDQVKARQAVEKAREDFKTTNGNLDELRKVLQIAKRRESRLKEPKLSDFYEPSPEMKKYQNMASAIASAGLIYSAVA